MYKAEFAQKLIEKFKDASIVPLPEKFIRDPEVTVRVPSAKFREVCQYIKSNSEFQCDLPNFMTAVDYIKENVFELLYYFYSTKQKQGLIIKVQVSRVDAEIDSVTDLWPGLDFQEREVFDLFGIKFKGHYNQKRIMMWDGFPGYPLRKDYVHVTDKYDSGLEVGTPGLDDKGVPVQPK